MTRSSDLVTQIYDAFAQGDVPTVLGAFAPDIEWREAEGYRYSDRNPYIGPQAIAEGVFQRLVTDLEGFHLTRQNLVACDDTVVVEGRYTCTVRATGAPIDAQFVHVWEVRDGRITRFQQYTDTGQWNDAMQA